MSGHVCPWWLGYFLLNPFRRLYQNPEVILAPLIQPGMTVLEVGPGMGFFSLPLARMAGSGGKVICVDVQEKMLRVLKRRAEAAGLAERIVARTCTSASLSLDDLSERIDFAIVFAVVHEVPDQASFFAELARALKPGACCLVAEPKGHVTVREFEASLGIAEKKGLEIARELHIGGSRAVLLKKRP